LRKGGSWWVEVKLPLWVAVVGCRYVAVMLLWWVAVMLLWFVAGSRHQQGTVAVTQESKIVLQGVVV